MNFILTAAVVAAGMAFSWSSMQSQSQTQARQIEELKIADAVIRAEIREVREKADAKLELLTRDMGEVRSSLKGISTNIEWIVRQSGKDARAPP
ncbi:hypothetical protein ACFONL_12830 [Camelimonas fluminis]|uniref:Uncharacterized protein n=1 Tax=Camelimonas fluminis TaxID=1576911 RepID=A0ABV7UIB5_9HYPH|nr:hypothetical protein [Camelimonas fluminis]